VAPKFSPRSSATFQLCQSGGGPMPYNDTQEKREWELRHRSQRIARRREPAENTASDRLGLSSSPRPKTPQMAVSRRTPGNAEAVRPAKTYQNCSRRFETVFTQGGPFQRVSVLALVSTCLTVRSGANSMCTKACDLIQRSADVPRLDSPPGERFPH
jgi:hypothetical protein